VLALAVSCFWRLAAAQARLELGRCLQADDAQVSYSFRHDDEDFLTRVPGAELPLLVAPSLVTCSFNVSLPDTTNDPDDPSRQAAQDGVMAYGGALGPPLVEALTAKETAPRALKALNTTLYTLSAAQLRTILERHQGLVVLNATVLLEPTEACKKELTDALALCTSVEQVEIVGSPSMDFHAAATADASTLTNVFPSLADIETLAVTCKKLNSFTANILRTRSWSSVKWAKEGEKWEGGVVQPTEQPAKEKNSKSVSDPAVLLLPPTYPCRTKAGVRGRS
jgi:hypothetical protein